MEAEFPGLCDYCGEDIEPGDEIKRRRGWEWVHEECAETIDEEESEQ